MQFPWDLKSPLRPLFSGRRGRDLKETLTAYLFLSPALLLIFLFGIFPVGFALYVSLHKWLIVRGEFRGLSNYVQAVDNFAYIGVFALGLAAIAGAVLLLAKIVREARQDAVRPWLSALPGLLHAGAVIAFFRWLFLQLPEFLDIATKMRGLERTRELFARLLSEAFHAETVYPAWGLFVWLLLAAWGLSAAARRWRRPEAKSAYQINFTQFWLSAAAGLGLLVVVFQAINAAYSVAVESGVDPGIWPQLIMVLSGVILLYAAWRLWRSAESQDSTRSFALRLLGAIGLILGGVLLIIEIPTIVASGDKNLWDGLKVTVFFSLGTVPVQLTIALFLSVLLFQRLRGSGAFRIIFFLPYVTPAIASATVFRLMFSERQSSPANTILRWLGQQPLEWLRESDGIFSMLASSLGVEGFPGSILPDWLGGDLGALLADWITGPSLALVVVIMLSIWSFVGYNTVIYLAGLANISTELTEAAEIDGANKWAVFRHITFPLLSPTTYFLSLIAVMGTFKAFNTIWVMRTGQALGTIDTFSVVIFEEFFNKARYGYASALAFVLFAIILSLTYINNRIQGSKVFYG